MYCCVAKRSQQLHAWLNEPGEKDGGRAGSERSWRLCCYRAFKKSPKLDEARHPPIGSPGSFGPRNGVRGAAELARRPVDRANAADFGLAASVFTRSRTTSELIASQLRVGMVSINSWVMYAGVSALPWGGVGQSGFGRIHGSDGLKEFTRAKSTVRERFGIPLQLTSFARHPKTTEVVRRMTSVMHGHGR